MSEQLYRIYSKHSDTVTPYHTHSKIWTLTLMSQCTKKPTIRHVWPAKTQISLRIRAVWSESSLIACAFYSLRAVKRGINTKNCHTGGDIQAHLCWSQGFVGFVVRWLHFHYLVMHLKTIGWVANGTDLDPWSWWDARYAAIYTGSDPRLHCLLWPESPNS